MQKCGIAFSGILSKIKRKYFCACSKLNWTVWTCFIITLLLFLFKSNILSNDLIQIHHLPNAEKIKVVQKQLPANAAGTFVATTAARNVSEHATDSSTESFKQDENRQRKIEFGRNGPVNSSEQKIYSESLEQIRLDDIYRKRRETMLRACAGNENNFVGNYSDKSVKSRIIIDLKQKLAYCTIEKTASTFWKRIFRIVIDDRNIINPFDPRVHAYNAFDKLTDILEEDVIYFMNISTKFLFVREPYARLFSGYVDKLFSPNILFWDIGRYTIKLVRKGASATDLRCGHNLSFREFVKYVIHAETQNVRRNGHFAPSYAHCRPCQYKYDIIGKLETLQQDTLYILNKIGKTKIREVLDQNFRGLQIQDTILDQTGWLFAMRKGYNRCLSFYSAQKRMWKKLQIRGIISKKSRYPVSRMNSESVTKQEFSRLLKQAVGDAVNRTEAKINKEEAFLEAYSTVDREDLERLSKIFKPDCDLFGYDCRPDKLFKQSSKIKPWYFDIDTA